MSISSGTTTMSVVAAIKWVAQVPCRYVGISSTRAPTSDSFSPGPTARTLPTPSPPTSDGGCGVMKYWPLMKRKSEALMVAASTSTSTWPGPGAGASNSTSSRTSAGALIAVIWSLRMIYLPDMLGLILFDDVQRAQRPAELHQPPSLTQAAH